MTIGVQTSSRPRLAGEPCSVEDCVLEDMQYSRRKSRVPIVGKIVKERIQWFYVKGSGVECPDELKLRQYRDIKESSIQLPATTESLNRLQRKFAMLNDGCRFQDLQIKYFGKKKALIFYSIRTRL